MDARRLVSDDVMIGIVRATRRQDARQGSCSMAFRAVEQASALDRMHGRGRWSCSTS
jgi:hypothetical protein